MHIDIDHLKEFSAQIDHSTNRLTVGVVLAALIVGSSITASVISGIATLPSMGVFLEHLALSVGFRAAYKSFGVLTFQAEDRSIRSLDHFAEVEEYFDGDPGLMQAIGPRSQQRQVTNRMGDFNAIIDFPPAPKLGPLMRLVPAKATPAELRGEELFHGKAQCVQCHYGPAFTDDYMHDLRMERFYAGRPEGPIKTFALRGIKDSPPYMHDGRCPTLQDTVELFNLIFELKLTKEEKSDLVAFLLCL